MALGVPLALNLRDRVDAEVKSQARSQADVVAATAADLLAPAQRANLRDLADGAAREVRGRVLIVNAAGRVLTDSAGEAARGDNYSSRPEIAAALNGNALQVTRRSDTLNTELLATAVPILRNVGNVGGAVRITQDVASVNRAVRRTILGLVLIGGVVLLLGLAAGVVIAAQVARPLHRLGEAAARVAEGDLSARAEVEGSAEQRSLARTFNDMTERVGRLLKSQRDFIADASHQLRTPLAGLRLRLEEAHAESTDQSVRDELEGGMAEVDRLADMVAELLVLSEAGERELPGDVVDLGDAADRAAERFAAIAAEREQSVQALPAGRAGAGLVRAPRPRPRARRPARERAALRARGHRCDAGRGARADRGA